MPLINHANVRAVASRYFEACLLFDACDAGSAVVSAGWERPSLYHIVSKEIIMIVGTEKVLRKNKADNKTPRNVCQYKIQNAGGNSIGKLNGYLTF